MRNVTAELKKGKYSLNTTAVFAGTDLNITICGGERPHIGAVAMAVPRASLLDRCQPSASTSVLCMLGHKEDMLAKEAAEKLSIEFHCVATVCVGIHIDGATAEEIGQLVKNYYHLLDILIKKIRKKLDLGIN